MKKQWASFVVVVITFLMCCGLAIAEEDVIKVGIMYSLTGTGAPTGKAQSEGALLAVKEVNEAED